MFLAMFPLRMVLFPGEQTPLHIYEPRYKQLIGECDSKGSNFGIPLMKRGRVQSHGTEVQLLDIERTSEAGEMDITIRGRHIFAIDDFEDPCPGKLYAGASVTRIEDDPTVDSGLQSTLVQKLRRLLVLMRKPETLAGEVPKNLSYIVAQGIGLNLEEKFELLTTPKETERQRILINHLDRIIASIREAAEQGIKIGGNGRSHKQSDA